MRQKHPQRYRQKLSLIFVLAAAIAMFLLNLAVGSVSVPLSSVLAILIGIETENPTWNAIIWQLRLPSAASATLAGSALAVAGLQMQTLFRNPLAGPFVLGINSGASLGVAIVVLSAGVGSTSWLARVEMFGDLSVVFAASAGAAVVLGLVLLVSRYVASTATLLILGLMFGNATLSLVSILLHFSSSDRIQSYLNWTFGSFAGVTTEQLPLFAGTIAIALFGTALAARQLNLLLLGDELASNLGLAIQLTRAWIIFDTAVLAGTVTAFCGPISFLGVAVPHLCRGLLKTTDVQLLIPATALVGATLALGSNWLAGLPGSELILPLNAVTALIGAPVVTWVILRRPGRS